MDKADRRWGVIILTHGRADRVITYSTLRKEGYTGPIYLLCDDEDEDLAKYKETFADKVIVFNKEEWIGKSDAFYNESPSGTPLYARNAASYITKHQLGWTHFIMMDDDYYHTYLKWNEFDKSSGCHKMRCKEATDLDALFDICFDLLDDTHADVIGLAQGGDMIGGARGSGGLNLVKRKVMNVFFIATDRCPTFRGFMNEDVNLYVEPSNNHFMF